MPTHRELTPIYDAVVAEVGVDPSLKFTPPPRIPLTYKARKRLSAQATRVLADAGFGAKE